jgi:hypothetical protein
MRSQAGSFSRPRRAGLLRYWTDDVSGVDLAPLTLSSLAYISRCFRSGPFHISIGQTRDQTQQPRHYAIQQGLAMDYTDEQPLGGHAVDSCESPENSLAEDDQV